MNTKTTQNRWWITGILQTASPLHIGNGDEVPNDRRVPIEENPDEDNPTHWAHVAAVVADANGRPWIPGASLRGALRAWLYRHFPSEELRLISLFGRGGEDDNGNEEAGKLIVYGACYVDDTIPAPLRNETAHFDGQRRTLVEAGVAIHRARGVASDQKLYYQEVIPPGVKFKVRLEARDVDKAEIELLLAGLDAFNSQGLVLGAGTRSAKGRCKWSVDKVSMRDATKLKNWVEDALLEGTVSPLEKGADAVTVSPATPQSKPRNRLDITLKLDALFCVNDPGRAQWSKAEKKRRPNDHTLADKLPRLDASGKAFLPAKSFRGVLRTQFERIARTLGIAVCGEGTGSACKPVHEPQDAERLCPACQFFGAPGWATLLDVTDFEQSCSNTAGTVSQEFVAIDRFTGGGADGKKFNACSVVRPELSGCLGLDETRFAGLKQRDSLLALLSLALRDVKEGDLQFGMGVAKGYGTCRAEFGPPGGAEWKKVADWLAAPINPLPWRNVLGQNASAQPAATPLPTKIPPEPTANPTNPGNHKFHNPYHFVPVTAPGHNAPGWLGKQAFSANPGASSHASYLNGQDGKPVYSGRIICRLTAETPLFIGARRTRDGTEQQPALVEGYERDGQPAIPATSLRGLISSLVEAATGSALRILDGRVLSYRRQVGEGPSAIGMLKKSKNNDQEFDLLPMTIPTLQTTGNDFELPGKWNKVFSSASLGECLPVYLDGYESIRVNGVHDHLDYSASSFLESAPDSYDAANPQFYYARLNGLTSVSTAPIPVSSSGLKKRPAGRSTFLLGQEFSAGADPLLTEADWKSKGSPSGYTKGILRVLGIDGRKQREVPGSKKHEFFLPIPTSPRRIPVSAEAVARFRALGQEREDAEEPPFELKGRPNWRPRSGDLVYFNVELDEAGRPYVNEFSVSAIWRGRVEETVNVDGRQVARAAGVHRFFETISGELLPFNAKRERISPAELIFGFTSSDRKEGDKNTDWLAYRGRVRPGFGICVKKPERLPEVTLKILDSPKPPSPNLYFQVGDHGITKATLHPCSHKPQGRKMYLHHRVAEGDQPWKTGKQEGTPGVSFKQHVRIVPLDRGAEFVFHLDFDNLTEWELGALCFALRPGEKFRHKLGMGKPLGLGTVRIDPEGLFLIDRPRRYTEDGPRYHQVWRVEEERVREWPEIYAEERKAGATNNAPTPAGFRDRCRAGLNPDVLRSLDLLGNPEFVRGKVHYPLAQGQNNEEAEHFKWFVNNEKWAMRDKNLEYGATKKAQRLRPLGHNSTDLSTLERNAEPPPKPKKSK